MTVFRARELVPYFGVKWLNERVYSHEINPKSTYFQVMQSINGAMIVGGPYLAIAGYLLYEALSK